MSASAADIDRARKLMAGGDYAACIEVLAKEVVLNPAHEAARVLLAEAYEKADRSAEAVATWQELMILSHDEENLRLGRLALNRLRRRELDSLDRADAGSTEDREDPFKIPMPQIIWEGLEVIEDSNYLPAIPGHPFEVPPFVVETKHFTVYTGNERFSKVVGERAETYLAFMIDKLFGGRAWALRFPIIVYSDVDDYQKHGGPVGSGGVTFRHITGKTQRLILYQLRSGSSRRSRSFGGQGIWKYGLESVLPHELTHAVINEFFAGCSAPRWMHEAIAGRFEQTRDHYGEAARLARKVVAGEYFRMRDLFEQRDYPERIALFYEQSAAIVLYLFETGPDAMHAFLSELAAGAGHDAACAAALGIPIESAVEEFERRWFDWMLLRYARDLDNETDDTDLASAESGNLAVFRPWVNEMDTVEELDDWRSIKLDSLDAFAGAGKRSAEWSVSRGMLRCDVKGADASSLLAIRMNEALPFVVSCEVRCLGSPGSRNRWFGFTQLGHDLNDTRVEALAPLPDNNVHTVVCVLSDDLAVYVDGTCVGRYPAILRSEENAPDIDYPIAMTAYGPVEVQSLKVAAIKEFSGKPVVTTRDSSRKPDGKSDRDRRSRRRRTRP